MPNLGRQPDTEYNLGQVAFDDPAKMRQFHESVRKSQRMVLPEEPEPITQLSADQQVFIYNVSPWRFEQHMGSYGTFTIHALDEAKVIADGLDVSLPLVIDGLPKEHYPTEGLPRPIYHQPRKNMGRESRRPGFDFAMEILGNGMMVPTSNDLRKQGAFISPFREPEKPVKGSDPGKWELWNKWAEQVKAAKAALKAYCIKQGQEGNMEYSRGKFADIRTDKLYQCVRIIKGTVLEYKWLGDTADTVKSKACLDCRSPLQEDALRCPHCGTKQMSDEKYAQEISKRQAMAG